MGALSPHLMARISYTLYAISTLFFSCMNSLYFMNRLVTGGLSCIFKLRNPGIAYKNGEYDSIRHIPPIRLSPSPCHLRIVATKEGSTWPYPHGLRNRGPDVCGQSWLYASISQMARPHLDVLGSLYGPHLWLYAFLWRIVEVCCATACLLGCSVHNVLLTGEEVCDGKVVVLDMQTFICLFIRDDVSRTNTRDRHRTASHHLGMSCVYKMGFWKGDHVVSSSATSSEHEDSCSLWTHVLYDC